MFENDRLSLLQRALCLFLAGVLSLGFGPSVKAQEDPGPGGDTTPAPTPDQPPPADPAPPAPPEGGAPPEQAPAGKIQGQLLDLDGTTPIANEQVRVTDASGKEVANATSGPDGKFELPMLQDGEYTLQTRGIQQRFSVTPDQPIKELKILVPAAPFVPAAGGTGDTSDTDVDQTPGGGWWIALGGGAVLLVGGLITGAVLAIANNSGKESDTIIGPQPLGGPTMLAGPSQPNPALTAEFGFLLGTNGVFPPTQVLDTSSKMVTITNNTGTPQVFTAVLSGAGFGFLGGTQNVSIPANGQANIILSFSPPTTGSFQGTLTVTGPGGMQTLNLTGIGFPAGVPSVSVP